MRRIDAGTHAGDERLNGDSADLADLGRWAGTVQRLTGGRTLRAVQRAALLDGRVLDSRRNLVVCAPTNSGKSLIGHLLLLDAVRSGRRAVLLEPLRALAKEQGEMLAELCAMLTRPLFPQAPSVCITTGDYRLDGESLAAQPPMGGEIVIATPERLDAITRNPDNAPWLASIGTVVVDEAHLIGDRQRGPTLELLIATLLSQPAPPRVVLLSATLGEPERLQDWLAPCQIIVSTVRTQLSKEVWALAEDESADVVLAKEVEHVLRDSSNAVLIFVYRRAATVALAAEITRLTGVHSLPYNAGQSAAERARIREAFASGACRCIVTTTALAMGVNLPATHVFVRDTSFFGHGNLKPHELLQILGRAGRGDRAGVGAVVLRSTDTLIPEDLAEALRVAVLPPIQSAFANQSCSLRPSAHTGSLSNAPLAAAFIASCLSRAGDNGMTKDELRHFVSRSFGGSEISPRLDESLRWLQDPSRILSFIDDKSSNRLTSLGRAGVRSVLPLPYCAGFGQLLRDLLSLDKSGGLLARWSAIDHLLIASLLSDRAPHLRNFSEELAEQIDGWLEQRPNVEKGLLFPEWIMGTASGSKASELLGSLGISFSAQSRAAESLCRKRAYLAMLDAIVLDERSRGVSVASVASRWRIKGLGGSEESWRDTVLWLLAGHVAICDLRSFYHHLATQCEATPEDIVQVKRAMRVLRAGAFDLMERLRFCSPLGSFLVDLRKSSMQSQAAAVGIGTVRTLESAGIDSILALSKMDEATLSGLGIQRRYARQIVSYLKRRMR